MFSASKSGQYQGYQISRSVRLRSSASAYFNRTPASAGNRKTWTWSGWVKRSNIGSWGALFASSASLGSGANFEYLVFTSSNTLQWVTYSTSTQANVITTQVFRDPSAWYHVVVAFDSTQATASNRVQMYINGAQVTAFGTAAYPSLNYNSYINLNQIHTIGRDDSGDYFDGYLTEINFIDGQALTPSSFGAYNAYGVWSPMKYNGTYGTNGFYLNFSDNSAATAAAIGKDYSGNGNNWTPNNISLTSGATYDSMLDVPTQWADGGNGRGNYATLNPLSGLGTISNANLRNVASGTDGYRTSTLAIPSSGKWYFEMSMGAAVASGCGITTKPFPTAVNQAESRIYYSDGNKYSNGSGSAYGATFTLNDVIGISYDADAGTLSFLKNNVSQGTAFSSLGSFEWFFYIQHSGTGTSDVTVNFGQRPFAYTPPSGFRALNTQNLPTPTIANGANYFAATTYTGTGASRSVDNTVNNVSFQPDFVWVKGRSGATDHALYDAVRGVQLQLESNTTTAETTETTGLTAFNSNGFTVGALAQMNTNTATYVGWQWKEGATQGFDIVTFSGTGGAQNISHSLGVAPRMIIMKRRNGVSDWAVGHNSLPWTQALNLNLTGAASTTATAWNNTAPTSSQFTVGSFCVSGGTYVAYLFAAVAGYSAFGSYTGNASTDGPFVFCGFRPRYVLVKRTDGADSWQVWDTARDTYNVTSANLYPNLSNAEVTDSTQGIDIVANGFKLRTSNVRLNASGGTYIFAAFAENPFKYSLAR
jgi:hypothetical protein